MKDRSRTAEDKGRKALACNGTSTVVAARCSLGVSKRARRRGRRAAQWAAGCRATQRRRNVNLCGFSQCTSRSRSAENARPCHIERVGAEGSEGLYRAFFWGDTGLRHGLPRFNAKSLVAWIRSSCSGTSMLRISSRCITSSSRCLSTSTAAAARSTAFRPKRDETRYGIPKDELTGGKRRPVPVESETDTSKHPLWRFFHEGKTEHGEEGQRVSLEVPDQRVDNSSERALSSKCLLLDTIADWQKVDHGLPLS